jgi:hypothetical protein
LTPAVKKLLSLLVSPSLAHRTSNWGGNPSTAGSADDTAVKDEILFTAGSYAELVAKTVITAGYSSRRDPTGHEPTVIRITAGYLKTVGEGPGGE